MIAWAPGTALGPYELIGRLGAGGMGEVWKARDTRVDRLVAIKRLNAEHAERFKREARAIAALNHPHICQLYDVGPDYLVMEYIDGPILTGPMRCTRCTTSRRSDRESPRRCTPERNCSSRSEAGEHPGQRERRETARLRARAD